MSKRKVAVYFLIILIVGAVLRFYGIRERGLFIPDETMYYRAAIATKAAVSEYFKNPGGNILGILLPAVDSFAGKPFHVLLGVFSFFLFGVYQYSPIMMTGIFGCLTIWLVFLIGRNFYNNKAGLIAAMLLSVSAFHIFYSRSFMAHADQTFFITLAAFFYLSRHFEKNKSNRSLVFAGLALGIAFTIHAVTISYIPLFIAFEIGIWIFTKPHSVKRMFYAICVFLMSFFAPAFIFELISIFGRNEPAPLFTFIHKGYFGQVVLLDSGDAIQNGLISNRNLGHWHLILLSGIYNGWLFTATMILSCAIYFLRYVWKKQSFIAFILFMLSSGILIYWQFFAQHERQFRLILSTYPFFCVIIGVFLSSIASKKGIKLLIVLLLMEGIWYSGRVIGDSKSCFTAVEKFLIENKAGKILTTSNYFTGTADVLMPDIPVSKIIGVSNWAEVKNQISPGGEKTYLLVHPDAWLEKDDFHFKAAPKLVIPDQFYFYFPGFYETAIVKGRKDYLSHRNDVYARTIAVFDINDLIPERK